MPLVSKNVERLTPGHKEDLDMFLSKYGVTGLLNAICIRLFEEQSTLEANGKDPSDYTRRRRIIETAMFEMRKLPESFDPAEEATLVEDIYAKARIAVGSITTPPVVKSNSDDDPPF